MNMELGLNIVQQQKLVMTQKMQLSVKILEMNNLDLKDFIEKAADENPVIDLEYSVEKPEEGRIDYTELLKSLEFDSYSTNSNNYYDKDHGEDLSPLSYVSKAESLQDFLIEQIMYVDETREIKNIMINLVGYVDSRGYLTYSAEEIAKQLKVTIDSVSRALEIFKTLEPCGIGSKDLGECLKLQLEEKGIDDVNLYVVVDKYLEYIAENKYSQLAKELSVTVKTAQEYGDIIKTLEPKPSRGFFTGEDVKYIIPDATITKVGSDFYVTMKNEQIPKLLINNTYKDIILKSNDEDATKFVKEKMDNALFLMKSIDQRQSTLKRVINEILDFQKEYFEKGRKHLKTMRLREIADRIEMHESTVSRAIRDKYINTDDGLVRIKDLFTTGITTGDDGMTSTSNVKTAIKDLIEKENREKPFSDAYIADNLKMRGMVISRRTVAKYREEMGIKASSKRKRF